MSAAIAAAQLRSLCPWLNADQAAAHAGALEAARPDGKLLSPLRVAHFMAQVLTETGGLRSLVENLNYRDPARLDELFSAVRGVDDAKALIAAGPQAIANRVYAGRGGNRGEASGDGWRYRGRGYLQITLHDNYSTFGSAIGEDLVTRPETLEIPAEAAMAAARYWDARGINARADRNQVTEVTRLINPGLAGLADRQGWFAKTRLVWAG